MSTVYKALLNSQMEMGSIKKDEKNPFFKSTYATLNAVRETVVPILNKNKLVLTQPTILIDGRQFVETRITHSESDEFISGITEVLVKNAGDAQQAGSGISYSRRYGLMSLLCLSADDDDGNTASGKVQNKAQDVFKIVETLADNKMETATITNEAPKKKISFNRKTTGDDL